MTRSRHREALETYWSGMADFIPPPNQWQMCTTLIHCLDSDKEKGGRGRGQEREMLTRSPITASVCNLSELKWKAAINSKKDLLGSARSEHWFSLDWAPYQCTFVIYLRLSHHSCYSICSSSIHFREHNSIFHFVSCSSRLFDCLRPEVWEAALL